MLRPLSYTTTQTSTKYCTTETTILAYEEDEEEGKKSK
jgi:hypothetical protein